MINSITMEKIINSKDVKVGMLMKWSGNYYDGPKNVKKILEKYPTKFVEGENIVVDVNYLFIDINYIKLDNGKIFEIDKNISYTIIEKEKDYKITISYDFSTTFKTFYGLFIDIVWLNGLNVNLCNNNQCNYHNTLIVYNNIDENLWVTNDFSNIQNIDELKKDIIKTIEIELKSDDKYKKYLKSEYNIKNIYDSLNWIKKQINENLNSLFERFKNIEE